MIKDLYKEIEDILLSMDLTVDVSYHVKEEEFIKIENPILKELVGIIWNRISNRNREFLIHSKSERNIDVDDLIKKLEELKKEKGNFEIGISQVLEDDYEEFISSYDKSDKNRTYLYGYTTELTSNDIKKYCEEELNVFKRHLRTRFYEYNQLLECKSIRDRFFEKYRAKKLNRIV